MGNRFITNRIPAYPCSDRRTFLLLNESGYEQHQMRPYGVSSAKFERRNMFETHGSRPGNKRVKRAQKRAERQYGKRVAQGEEE